MTSFIVSAPVVLLAAAGAVLLTVTAGGGNPVWRAEPLNLPEAAALRDRAEVARLLTAGADPQAERTVRAGFLYQYATPLTAVDAAIQADRPEILQLLLDSGLALAPDAWHRAWCAASSREMRAVLVEVQPPGDSSACPSRANAAPAD